MRPSRIAILAALTAAGLWAQKQTNPLEDHTSYDQYSKDSESRKRSEELKSIGRGNPEERRQHAMAELQSANDDIEKLNQLSAELKTAVASNNPDVLTKASLKRGDEIEKLAKNIKAKMRKAAQLAQVD